MKFRRTSTMEKLEREMTSAKEQLGRAKARAHAQLDGRARIEAALRSIEADEERARATLAALKQEAGTLEAERRLSGQPEAKASKGTRSRIDAAREEIERLQEARAQLLEKHAAPCAVSDLARATEDHARATAAYLAACVEAKVRAALAETLPDLYEFDRAARQIGYQGHRWQLDQIKIRKLAGSGYVIFQGKLDDGTDLAASAPSGAAAALYTEVRELLDSLREPAAAPVPRGSDPAAEGAEDGAAEPRVIRPIDGRAAAAPDATPATARPPAPPQRWSRGVASGGVVIHQEED